MQDNTRFFSGPLYKTVFKRRPNRFLLHCHSAELGSVEAFLPNPGRMRELLLPEVPIYLTEAGSANPDRKTRFTAVAVERHGVPIFLHTHVTNAVARHLLEQRRMPGLEGATVQRAEVPVGRSRFDFLLRENGEDLFLEVKSCTLFANGVAMFPDAVTARGRKHLLELAALAKGGTRAAVVFLVHYPKVRCFMPDYHTDPAFSDALLEVRDRVRVLPVAISWRKDLSLGRVAKPLEIPWEYVARENQDCGSYLLLMRLKRQRRIRVGKLGTLALQAGYYVYVGSAMGGLTARVARHLRASKKKHWHVDYLRPHVSEVEALPIRSSKRIECSLAKAMAQIMNPGPKGFGCSDCRCSTHIFYSAAPPQDRPEFHAVLERFRMQGPR